MSDVRRRQLGTRDRGFAPALPIVPHYGPDRARSPAELAAAPPNAIVITSYGLLRRDAELLGAVDWSTAALDEAQNIENPASRTAQAARSLRASFRVALTGTPVENRLAELWSIFDYLNPRLLGPLERFRRDVAVPIERSRRRTSQRTHARRRPFLLRRLKSDPAIIQDLPAKQEMKVVCTLTREQASLYQAAVDETMRKIESSEGIQRRGLVLALITALKQICNHPAHYLGEAGRSPAAPASSRVCTRCSRRWSSRATGHWCSRSSGRWATASSPRSRTRSVRRCRSCTAGSRAQRATRWSSASRTTGPGRRSSCFR